MLLFVLLSAVLQLLVFAAVPFITYLVTRRRARGFFAYVGLVAPTARSLGAAAAVAVLFTGVMLILFRNGPLHAVAIAPNTVAGRLRALGPSASAFAILAIYAVLQTSLTEELLFRGFLAKRLIAHLGFPVGNGLQAVLFGLMHLLLFAGPGARTFDWTLAAILVTMTGLVGWLFGYVNERVGNGSILPSWGAHGATNLLAYSILAFTG
jgi:membrane protease YdiL (CAAX protease family)